MMASFGQRDCQWSGTDFECRFQLPDKVGLKVEAELPDFNHATPADHDCSLAKYMGFLLLVMCRSGSQGPLLF